MKRVLADEWLDADDGSPAEIAAALRSLRWVNALFGGNRMHTRLLTGVLRRTAYRDLHVLEVASGGANVLQAALVKLSTPERRFRVSLLDRSCQHLPRNGEWNPQFPPPALFCGDALALPLADGSVDVVASCLFLHHLTEEETCVFFKEALRVARVAVVVNDLERSRIHYALAQLASLLDPSRLSEHDGPVSVRRAYTPRELTRILSKIGARFHVQRGFLFRLGVTVWKDEA